MLIIIIVDIVIIMVIVMAGVLHFLNPRSRSSRAVKVEQFGVQNLVEIHVAEVRLFSAVGWMECLDMIKLPVRGTNKTKWVLLLNINPEIATGDGIGWSNAPRDRPKIWSSRSSTRQVCSTPKRHTRRIWLQRPCAVTEESCVCLTARSLCRNTTRVWVWYRETSWPVPSTTRWRTCYRSCLSGREAQRSRGDQTSFPEYLCKVPEYRHRHH